MGILAWIVIGLIAGGIAKAIHPGKDPGGFIVTMLIGIAGAVVGGFLFSFIGVGSDTDFSFGSLLIAIVGAVLLLWLYRKFTSNRA